MLSSGWEALERDQFADAEALARRALEGAPEYREKVGRELLPELDRSARLDRDREVREDTLRVAITGAVMLECHDPPLDVPFLELPRPRHDGVQFIKEPRPVELGGEIGDVFEEEVGHNAS